MNISLPVRLDNKIIMIKCNIVETIKKVKVEICKSQYKYINNYNFNNLIKVPYVNKYNCICFIKLFFPLEFVIIPGNNDTKYIYNHNYFIIKINNNNSLPNTFDFFNILNNTLKKKYSLYYPLKNDNIDNFKNIIYNDEYITDNNIKLEKFITLFYNNIQNLFNNFLYGINNNVYFKNNIMNKLFTNFKNIKISYLNSVPLTIQQHLDNLSKSTIVYPNRLYVNTKKETKKMFINDISSIKSKCKVSYYPFNIKKSKLKFIFFLIKEYNKIFINIVNIVINNKIYIMEEHKEKFILFCNYYKTNMIENIFYIMDIYNFNNSILYKNILCKNHINLISRYDISNKFFIDYTSNKDFNILILQALLKKYNFPLTYNKKELNNNFTLIIYYSLNNINKIIKKENDKLIIYDNILKSIPVKIKILYINLIKIFYSCMNNNYKDLWYNIKIYNDDLHFIVFKKIIENKLICNIKKYNCKEISKHFYNIIFLKELAKNINWNNIKYNLDKIKILITNYDKIFINNRINKNIIDYKLDNKIIKILKDPFNLYKYLYSISDYIKWNNYIYDNINKLFNNYDKKLTTKDIINLSTILYYIINLPEQNLTNSKYLHLLNLCKKHKNLVVYNDRFNLILKPQYFFNYNINLGYLIKHINMNDNNIIITSPFTTEDILRDKLKKLNKKYVKCKKELELLRLETSVISTNYTCQIENKS